MASKIPYAISIAAGGLVALGYAAMTLSASGDEPSNPAVQAVAELPTVTASPSVTRRTPAAPSTRTAAAWPGRG